MKKLKVLGLFVLSLLMCGCLSYNVNMSINADKSVDVGLLYKVDFLKMMSNPLFQGMTPDDSTCDESCSGDANYDACFDACKNTTLTEDQIKENLDQAMDSGELDTSELFDAEDREAIEKNGYKIEENLDKENYLYTVKITKHFNNIDEISTNVDGECKLWDVFVGEQNNFFAKVGDAYKANFAWDEEDITSSDTMDGMDIDLSSFLDFQYEVSLPNGSISNNATEVASDGKKLIWKYNTSGSENINYQFSFPKKAEKKSFSFELSDGVLKIISLALIGVGSLVLVITIVTWVKQSRR